MEKVVKSLILMMIPFWASAKENSNRNARPSFSVGTIFKNISPADFKHLIESEKGIILDFRKNSEVAQGRIKGPIHIDKAKPFFIYCASGGRSSKAMKTLKNLGFSKVYNLMGGIQAWNSAGCSVVK